MSKLGSKVSFDLRPDAQAFDEVRIITVPRYKQSGLSGDEWRIHGEIQLFRKGKLIHTEGYRNVETACGFAFSTYVRACDDGKAYFSGDGEHCDQEGCSELATVTYRVKKKMCAGPGMCGQEKPDYGRIAYRCFCDKHKTRGDAGLDDCDSNYWRETLALHAELRKDRK